MIISRTPFRVSFFGGGTDYPGWFKDHKGAVLATTIDKYCYISSRYLPPFFEYKSRIVYSKVETPSKVEEIEHPAVREVLKFLQIKRGIEIHHDGDLPARTGLGSSSSFTVGLLNVLYALRGQITTKEQLTKEAIFVEQEMCKENVGCQDQALAAHGGFNYMEFFGGKENVQVYPLPLAAEKLKSLQDHLMMYFSGFSRMASEIAGHQIKNIPKKQKELQMMYQMTQEAKKILNGKSLNPFGKLLHESWRLKRSLSDKITTPAIDDLYEKGRSAGALGGKLLGAGGGGFVLLFAEPHKQANIRKKLKGALEIPFKFESLGSQIIFNQPNSGIVA